jgi:hypothetical protein
MTFPKQLSGQGQEAMLAYGEALRSASRGDAAGH